jgi:hypothetical protein
LIHALLRIDEHTTAARGIPPRYVFSAMSQSSSSSSFVLVRFSGDPSEPSAACFSPFISLPSWQTRLKPPPRTIKALNTYPPSICLASCPNPSSSSSFVLDHTVPYGTAPLGGVFPGTSCQATIAPSLRDNSQQALARCCCEMSASESRRDDTDRSLARSAWKSVPRKNRPVGYGMIGYEGRPERLSRALNRYTSKGGCRDRSAFIPTGPGNRQILREESFFLSRS